MLTVALQRQKLFYNQIQQDKEDDDSTFLDVARIAVEKELQTIEEQPDPDQHKLDDDHLQINNQDHQNGDQDQQHDEDHQHDQDKQHEENQHDGDHQHNGHQQHKQDQHNDQAQPHDQDEQHDNQDEQHDQNKHNDQEEHNDQQHNNQDFLNQEQYDQNQQNNDQVIQDNQVNDQDNNQDGDQGQQLIHHSQSQQHITNQTSIDDHTDRTGTTGAENQDETLTDTQIVTTSQSEIPSDTPQTSDAQITEKINHKGTDRAVIEDSQQQKDSVTDLTSTHNIVTVANEDNSTTKLSPELTTQDTPLIVTQDCNSQPALLQDDINGAGAATESGNTSDKVAELSMANLAAHDIANPPLIERTNTQQTLTSVTMLDNPIRLEQFSRSSLDSDYNKNQQITQAISTTAVIGDKKPNDDVILISGMVDTGAVKSSVSSSTLSNITDLTE